MSLADDCELLVKVLSDAPKGGLTMTEINEKTGWTIVLVNDILCALGKAVVFTKVREKNRKVTRYSLRDGI